MSFAFNLVIALTIPTAITAWTQYGPPWLVDRIPVPMEANRTGTPDCEGITEYGSLARAGRSWSRVGCSFFTYRVGPGHPNNLPGGVRDGVNNIVWETGTVVPSITFCWFENEVREECDIVFGESIDWSCSGEPGMNEIDMETIALHELGHVAGLGHSIVFEAVMYPVYVGVRRNLHTDDSTGLCTIYPAIDTP
jgi:hypothetical protein